MSIVKKIMSFFKRYRKVEVIIAFNGGYLFRWHIPQISAEKLMKNLEEEGWFFQSSTSQNHTQGQRPLCDPEQ